MIAISRLHDRGIYQFQGQKFEETVEGLMGYRYSLRNEYSLFQTSKKLHYFIFWRLIPIAFIAFWIFYIFFYEHTHNFFTVFGSFGLAVPILYIELFLVLIVPYYIFRKVKLQNSLAILQIEIEKALYNELLDMKLGEKSGEPALSRFYENGN